MWSFNREGMCWGFSNRKQNSEISLEKCRICWCFADIVFTVYIHHLTLASWHFLNTTKHKAHGMDKLNLWPDDGARVWTQFHDNPSDSSRHLTQDHKCQLQSGTEPIWMSTLAQLLTYVSSPAIYQELTGYNGSICSSLIYFMELSVPWHNVVDKDYKRRKFR